MVSAEHQRSRSGEWDWVRSWPYGLHGVGIGVVAAILLSSLLTASGLAVTEWLAPTPVGEADADLTRWFERQRTPELTTLADLASVPADTFVVIGILAALLVALPALLRRWDEWVFLGTALLLEVVVALTSSFLVARPRPPVEQLATPPTESWPSGHTAAAVTLYGGLAMVAWWHTSRMAVRLAIVALAVLVPVMVATSRLYLGAHYLSDIVAGVLLGVAVLVTTQRIFRTADDPAR